MMIKSIKVIPTINIKPIARLLVFAMALLCVITINVEAETLTYNVCESGCEYTNLDDVKTAINNISDLSDKDIIINVNSDMSDYMIVFGTNDNMANSLIINGNSYNFSDFLTTNAKKIEINNCNNLEQIDLYNPVKISIKNSDIMSIMYYSMNTNNQIKSEEINLKDVFDIDESSVNNLNILALTGNFKIKNMNFKKILLQSGGGTLNIYNSQIYKLINVPQFENITTNIYNSEFTDIKYKNITTAEEFSDELYNKLNLSDGDLSKLNYDIYDIDFTNMGDQFKSLTTVYFDKEAKLKPNDKLNLVSYLDYYTEDKEIEYTIEDDSIAKIDNKELIGLKEGRTKVTVTTDEGHVVYNINLSVEKETIPEKIDKMTIKVPITGSRVKAWVVVVSVILLGVIGICSYMLIRRKK